MENAFCQMCVTVCVQLVGMIFQIRSKPRKVNEIMIYEFEPKEGFYLAAELEKHRKKKRHDKLVMKCDEATNQQVKIYKSMYVLNGKIRSYMTPNITIWWSATMT